MELIEAVDAVDELIYEARLVPLTDEVRVDAAALGEAIARLRSLAAAEFGLMPDRHGAMGELFAAVEELEQRLAAARKVPMTDQVRLSPEAMYDALDRVRASYAAARHQARGEPPPEPPPWGPLWRAVQDVHDRVAASGRHDAETLRPDVAHLREVARTVIGDRPDLPVFTAIDELDALLRDAKPGFLGRRPRVAADDVLDGLDAILASLAQSADEAAR